MVYICMCICLCIGSTVYKPLVVGTLKIANILRHSHKPNDDSHSQSVDIIESMASSVFGYHGLTNRCIFVC